MDTPRFNNYADFLYRLATLLGMRLNHEYWCKCTWRTNSNHKTATSDLTWPPLTVGLPVTSERYWASFQVTRLFHIATVSQCDHCFAATYVFVVWNFTRLITRLITSIWWGSTQLQCIYYLHHILIPKPPRVFLHFKRRSCHVFILLEYNSKVFCRWQAIFQTHQLADLIGFNSLTNLDLIMHTLRVSMNLLVRP